MLTHCNWLHCYSKIATRAGPTIRNLGKKTIHISQSENKLKSNESNGAVKTLIWKWPLINIVSTAGQIKKVQKGTSLDRNSFMSGMHVTKLSTASTQQHCRRHLFLFDGIGSQTLVVCEPIPLCEQLMVVCAKCSHVWVNIVEMKSNCQNASQPAEVLAVGRLGICATVAKF